MGLFDFFRTPPPETKAELAIPVWETQLKEAQAEIEKLTETAADDDAARKMLARRVEDLTYTLLDVIAGNDDPSAQNRKNIRKRSFRYWQDDPIIGQAINLQTWYTFGRGVPRPQVPQPAEHPDHETARKELGQTPQEALAPPVDPNKPVPETNGATPATEAHLREAPDEIPLPTGTDLSPPDQTDDQADPKAKISAAGDKELTEEEWTRANRVIENFWDAPENKRVLTSLRAQEEKSGELQIDGEIFLVGFPGPGAADNGGNDADEPTLLMADIDPDEIKVIIPRSENVKMPVWYERSYAPVTYNYQERRMVPGTEVVRYYKDWHNEPEDDDQSPPPDRVESDAKIMHIAVNKLSRQQRGVSEVKRVLEWSKGFHEFMEGRLAVARALQKIAQRIRVEGGPRDVRAIMQAVESQDFLALTRTPLGDPESGGALPSAGTMVHTGGMDVQPANFETGASSAMADKAAFLGMIAAGTNWPAHYLGGEGSSSLANLTAMEAPTLKNIEARQELWEQVFKDLCIEALRLAGIEDVEVEVTMPQILQRDLTQITGSSAAIVTAIDPQSRNVRLKRVVLEEFLSALGKARVSETVDDIFPAGYEEPAAPGMAPQTPGATSPTPEEAAGMDNQSLLDKVLQRKSPVDSPVIRSSAGMKERLADPKRGQAHPSVPGRIQ